jgi:hypothetical protein
VDPRRPTPDDPEVGLRLALALRLAAEAGRPRRARAGRLGAATVKRAAAPMAEAGPADQALARGAIAERSRGAGSVAGEPGPAGPRATPWISAVASMSLPARLPGAAARGPDGLTGAQRGPRVAGAPRPATSSAADHAP